MIKFLIFKGSNLIKNLLFFRKVAGASPSIIECVNSFVNEKENKIYKSEKDSVNYKSEKDTVFSEKESTLYKSDYLKSEDSDYSEAESINESRIYSESERDETDFIVNPSWMFDEELGKGEVCYLVQREETFWINVIDAYLKPIVLDEETKEKNVGIPIIRLFCPIKIIISFNLMKDGI